MARAIWDGSISFGLINIPIRLYSMDQKVDLNLHMIDSRDHARVRYLRVNEDTGEEVPWDEMAKGYEYKDGQYVVLDIDEINELHVKSSQTIDLEEFVDLSEIPYYYFEKPYVLAPGKKAEKSYVLLREILAKKKKAALGKVTIRTRQHLAAIVAEGDALILNILRFEKELKALSTFELPSSKTKSAKLSKKEMDLAENLVESLTAKWNPGHFHDDYRKALQEYVNEQMKRGKKRKTTGKKKKKKESASNVIDIAALLEKSIKENKKKSS